jgi:hypothetical protein
MYQFINVHAGIWTQYFQGLIMIMMMKKGWLGL